MSFDNVCKLLAEKYPQDFARWLLPEEPRKIRVLKTELSIEPIRADFLTFLQTENQILHIEFQTRATSKTPISLRMLDYYVRLTRQYKIPVTQVVIFLQKTNHENVFIEEYVSETTTHRYRVIRMWEQDSALFLDNPALLPLAPLTCTNSPQSLLSQVSQNVAKISDRETKQDIAAYTGILAGLRFEKNLIRQLLSEEIMQESVIYQDIFQKGEQRGEQQGEQRTIIRILNRRFGEIDSSLLNRVRMLTIEKLDDLAETLLDFSDIADLVTWLNQHENFS
ncbi:Rpn family recombination-promoting nuclease/putative transposase [Nostoc sp.]|uniref:Rpn family recombination-promoting nuclease/putative transposase n=1 Tax=Nostoc sp. TaxID=1180 RepID=UPI002FFA8068